MSNIFTIEAVKSSKSLLDVPNLHILIKKSQSDKNIWVGHCLDLNINALSTKKKEEAIIQDIFDNITEMAMGMILRLLKKNRIEDLFKGAENNSGRWEDFNKEYNKQKIKQLKESYKRYIINDIRKIEKQLEEKGFSEEHFHVIKEILAKEQMGIINKLTTKSTVYQLKKVA